MKVQWVANRIYAKMVKRFYRTGETVSCVSDWRRAFPGVSLTVIYGAIRLLDCQGKIEVLYAEGAPQDLVLNLNQLQGSKGVLHKVYDVLKEVRRWV